MKIISILGVVAACLAATQALEVQIEEQQQASLKPKIKS
jgi:hypothetical protein